MSCKDNIFYVSTVRIYFILFSKCLVGETPSGIIVELSTESPRKESFGIRK